jgi:hypothetical protein
VRPAESAPGLTRLDGNRVWRVETPQGPVLQKLYADRGSRLHAWGRDLATSLRGGKTGTRAAARRATEARLLALWRAHGCDVPADVSASHPELANERTLVLECVEGVLLSQLLADPALRRGRRDELIERFASGIGARHTRALELGEAGLVHEHGGTQHVLVSGTGPARGLGAPGPPAETARLPVAQLRFVNFDLENSFAPRADLQPLLAKELAASLRSLARGSRGDQAGLRADVEAFARGYGDAARLKSVVGTYLHNRSPLWRLVWAIDRRREEQRGAARGKFVALRMLDDVLRSEPGRGPLPAS